MPKVPGAPRKRLTVETKLDLLKKLDEGWRVSRVWDHFGVKKKKL